MSKPRTVCINDCPACNGAGEHEHQAFAGCSSPYDTSSTCWSCYGTGQIEISRTTTRAQWARKQELADDAESSLGLLRNTQWDNDGERASMLVLRAEASCPVDTYWARKNAHWATLHAALADSMVATQAKRAARARVVELQQHQRGRRILAERQAARQLQAVA